MSTLTQVPRKKTSFLAKLGTAGIGALMVYSIAPILWTLYTSFRSSRAIMINPTSIDFSNLSFSAYGKVWRDTNFPILVRNSLIVCSITVLLSLT